MLAEAEFLRSCKTVDGIVSVSGVVPARTNPGPGRRSRVSAAVVFNRPRRIGCFGASLGLDMMCGREKISGVSGRVFGVKAIRPPVVAWRLRGSRRSRGGS